MRKNVFGRQFKRDVSERRALFKNLISSLILRERMKTTEEKAKAIKGDVDKIITKAKRGEIARRLLQHNLTKKAVDKVMLDLAPRFSKRQGGYTRITKLGRRFSDNAPMVLMEWVEGNKIENKKLRVENRGVEQPKEIKETKKIVSVKTQSRGLKSTSRRKKSKG